MRILEAFPSNYLRAADLQGRNVRVTIASIGMEDVGDASKPVLYFEGKDRGLVLNKTNSNNIAAIYGDETDLWAGKEVVLYSTMVDFQGRSVEAIRVRRPTAKDGAGNGAAKKATPAASKPAVRESENPPPAHDDMNDEIPF
jgi:hypothetical protein